MYKNYLRSKHWKNKKKEAYESKPYQCFFCSKKYGLDLHHITYENIGKELVEDLVYLCRRCHNHAHKSGESEKVKKWLDRSRSKKLKAKKYVKKAPSWKAKIRRYNKKRLYRV